MFSCGILGRLWKIKLHKNMLRIVGGVAGQTSYVVTYIQTHTHKLTTFTILYWFPLLFWFQANKNVFSKFEQLNNCGLYSNLHFGDFPRHGLLYDIHGSFSVYMHGTGMDFNVRFYSKFWLHVQQNLASSFNIHKCATEQKSDERLSTLPCGWPPCHDRYLLLKIYCLMKNFKSQNF